MRYPLFWLFALSLSAGFSASDAIVFATYNIRYENPEDAAEGNGWEARREQVRGLIHFHKFDIVGLQEVTPGQLPDLEQDLAGHDHVGSPSYDGLHHGSEHVPVFYRRDRFELVDGGTFWLSPTPDTASIGWDAMYQRICTWARLRDRRTGKTFQAWNTHLDHRGERARPASAELLLQRLKPLLKRGEPVVVMGDFNFTPDSEGYQILRRKLADARDHSILPAYGPKGTSNRFDYNGVFERRIDHIFVTKGIKTLRHGTLTDSYNHRFPSDHFPVAAELVLPD